MPEEHFTEDQVKAIKELFTQQVNSALVKIVAANITVILAGAIFIGVWWNKVEYMEAQVASVKKQIDEGPRFTQEEGDSLRSAMMQRDDDLQRQIDALKGDMGYIRERVDQIYNILR
jgi:hypothetical protein